MRRILLGALLQLAACGGDRQDPPPPPMFDLDVVVRVDSSIPDGVITVWLREGFATGCPEMTYPRPGECAPRSRPFPCKPTTDFCVSRAVIAHEGFLSYEAKDVSNWWHSISINVYSLFGAPQPELILFLCDGEEVRVPIEGTFAPGVILEGAKIDGDTLFADWHSDISPDRLLTALGPMTGALYCHVEADDPVAVPKQLDASFGVLDVIAVVEGATVSGPRGTARVWFEGPSLPEPIAYPISDGAGWYVVDAFHPVASLGTDGLPDNVGVDTFAFRPTRTGPRVRLVAGDFEYTAGDTIDEMVVMDGGRRYTATFPHVAPLQDLQVAVPLHPMDRTVSIQIPPVFVSDETGDLLSVSLDLNFQQIAIPTPVAPP